MDKNDIIAIAEVDIPKDGEISVDISVWAEIMNGRYVGRIVAGEDKDFKIV